MIIEKVETIGGKEITLYTPENDADRAEIQAMERNKKIKDRSSFADDLKDEGNTIDEGTIKEG